MKDNNLQFLYRKFLNGLCSPEELTLLFDYFKTGNKEELQSLIQKHFTLLDDECSANSCEDNTLRDVFFKIKAKTHADKRAVLSIPLRWKFSIAAMLLIAFSLTIYLYKDNNLHTQNKALYDSITPGGNKATLTLTNNKTIDLSEEKDGLIINNNEITYSDGTKIGNSSDLAATEYITITTPKGGQYKVVLSDGTRVWLNAASSLRYPVKFIGDRQRRVVLTGEAYFEVESIYSKTSKIKKKVPFIVETAIQEVKVLGTHFNINSYVDEASIKTTLLEGSVSVSILNTEYSVLLKPNQESSIIKDSNKIKVNSVDPENAIAWKNGVFRFDKADIYTVMRQISRWYNIEVVYEGEVSYESFYGEIQRNYDLNEVLNVLKVGGVEFRIEVKNGKKQIVVI